MRAAGCLLLLLLLAPARAQDAPPPPDPAADAAVRAAIEGCEALLAEGKLLEAKKRLYGAKDHFAGTSREVYDDLFVTRLHLSVAGASRYAANEDGGILDPAGFPAGAFTFRRAAAKLYQGLLQGLHKLEEPAVRARLVADPALRALDDLPEMRVLRWSQWRTPRGEVWPDTTLDTGDAGFDALFARLATAPIPDAGYEIEPLHEWVEAQEARQRTPGAVWAFRFRCALGNPVNQGGWPTRMGLLGSAETCREAIAELTPKGGAKPQGFAAAVLVNLHVAAGDPDEVLELLRGLRASGPRFLHDVTLHHAQQLAAKRFMANQADADLKAFSDELDELTYGLPPAAPPVKGGEGEKPKR